MLLVAAVTAALLVPAVSQATDGTGSAGTACRSRTLVLSAMPIELTPLLAAAEDTHTTTIHGRDYTTGRLRGHDVVLALTGIGPVNARHYTRQALRDLRCGGRPGIDSIVFSGVAGGAHIGDVVVPVKWTGDAGRHLVGVDPQMLTAARRAARGHVPLAQQAPAGDPACACVTDPDLVETVSVTGKPRMLVGGTGDTTDPFGGRALQCAPGGGDVFGCEPCPLQKQPERDAERFAPSAVPFLDPDFFAGYLRPGGGGSGGGHFVAEDEETASVAAVAASRHLPFLGLRGVSDGGGDPLHLPGFPFQFFYYRQLAADNAAVATLAFLAAWPGR
jgi:nucleoside phosphorylase